MNSNDGYVPHKTNKTLFGYNLMEKKDIQKETLKPVNKINNLSKLV